MSLLRLEDDLLDRVEWVRAIRDGGTAALHLWLKLASWCGRQGTNGIVPVGLVREIAGARRMKPLDRALNALLQHGLCKRADDGSIEIVGVIWEAPARRVPRKPVSTGTRFRIFQRDGFRCCYCGAAPPDATLVIDHATPVVAGGSNDPSNLVTACQTCNGGKGALLLEDE